MPEDADIAWTQLERYIRLMLFGDEKNLGLYRTLRSSNDWPTFLRANGRIDAYEDIGKQMLEIARRLNSGDEARASSAAQFRRDFN